MTALDGDEDGASRKTAGKSLTGTSYSNGRPVITACPVMKDLIPPLVAKVGTSDLHKV